MDNQQIIAQGNLKYKDGRKWKTHWGVVIKLSPVADCLHLDLYGDSKDFYKNGIKKSSLSLENFLAMEVGFSLDKEHNTMALICKDKVVILAFDSQEMLICWQMKIKNHSAQEEQFLVQIVQLPSRSKLTLGSARLHLQEKCFALVTGIPPKLAGIWPFDQLRRFGIINGKFCFEGGSFCGKGEGVHLFQTQQLDELSEKFQTYSSKLRMINKPSLLKRHHTISSSSLSSIMSKNSSFKIKPEEERIYETIDSIANFESDTCSSCSELLRINYSNEEQDSDETLSLKSICTQPYSSMFGSSSSKSNQPLYNSRTTLVDNSFNSLNENSFKNQSSICKESNTLTKKYSLDHYESKFCNTKYCVHCGEKMTKLSSISPVSRLGSNSTISTLISDHFFSNNDHFSSHQFKCSPSIVSKNKRLDQTSLCSSSSQSSSSSNNSSSCVSNYHNCLDNCNNKSNNLSNYQNEIYDKPKNIKHENISFGTNQETLIHSNMCSCQFEEINQIKKSSTFNNCVSESFQPSTCLPTSRLSEPTEKHNDNLSFKDLDYYQKPKSFAKFSEKTTENQTLNFDLYDIPKNFEHFKSNNSSNVYKITSQINDICDCSSNELTQVTNISNLKDQLVENKSLISNTSKSTFNYMNLEYFKNENEKQRQILDNNYIVNYSQVSPIYAKIKPKSDKVQQISYDTEQELNDEEKKFNINELELKQKEKNDEINCVNIQNEIQSEK